MLFLYIDQNHIKLFHVKKSLLGQYSIGFYQKKFQVDLLKNGKVVNSDVLASAMKEIAANVPSVDHSKDKEVTLILPQNSFHFLRTEVPSDVSSSAVLSFIKDKIKSSFPSASPDIACDYFYVEDNNKKHISLYCLDFMFIEALKNALGLLDYRLINIYPDTLSYYKLFEKTLRKGKIEHIIYGTYEKEVFNGYIYDSYGFQNQDKIEIKLSDKKDFKTILKEKAEEFEKKNQKINRFILSGINADTVRQDLFTKEVGMWTNPLKRIIPQFYSDYTKLLMMPDGKLFPLLELDVCLGAFIFSIENKYFSLMKKQPTQQKQASLNSPLFAHKPHYSSPKVKVSFLRKEVLLFVVSFGFSFLLFQLISQGVFTKGINFFPPKKIVEQISPTMIPPTPKPTIAIQKETYKIKVLNGSGTKGKASEVKDILKENKYQDIITGNADNFDYTTTEINIKKSKIEIRDYLIKELNDYVSKPKIGTIDEAESADVIIIIGTDFK